MYAKKKIFLISIKIIMFLAVMVLIGKGLRYILYDDSNIYTRTMMHEFSHSEQNIDALFVGSSHVYRSCVPSILDEELGMNTFVAGSSAQRMDASYQLIKEAIKNNKVKKIYLELYHAVVETKYSERNQMTSTYIISDYLPFSFSKIKFLLQASSSIHWSNSFIVARRNFDKITDFEYLKTVWQNKSTDSYKNYCPIIKNNLHEKYETKGYVSSQSIGNFDETLEKSSNYIDVLAIKNSDWQKSVLEISELCKKNNVELVFFISPMPELRLLSFRNYQEYDEYISKLATDLGVKFYDFNLVKHEYLDTNNPENFMDTTHLNASGSETFSHIFAKTQNDPDFVNEIMYQNISEKLASETPTLLGIKGLKDENKDISRYYIVCNHNDIKSEVIAIPDNRKEYLVKSFDTSAYFKLPSDEHGLLRIKWSVADGKINYREIKY